MTTTQATKVGADRLYRKIVDEGRLDAHGNACKRAAAILCAVGIECEHGRDVCSVCDPCSCGKCEADPHAKLGELLRNVREAVDDRDIPDDEPSPNFSSDNYGADGGGGW